MATLLSALQRKAEFVYPGRTVPRTAVLVPWFRPREGGRGPDWVFSNWFRSNGPGARGPREPVISFDGGWSEAVATFAPSAIAATPAQLGLLALSGVPSLRHAVVALTRLDEPRLSESDRGRLWAAFRVPVFEQIIGERGRLVAAECEAHDGLHIEISPAELAEMAFRDQNIPGQSIDDAQCACGRKTPRLVFTGGSESAEERRRIRTLKRVRAE